LVRNATTAKIGYALLVTEQTIQDDVMKLRPEGVGIHLTRVPNPDSMTNEIVARQVKLLANAVPTLLPDGSTDVICYACTSGSLVIGEERVFLGLNKGQPGAGEAGIHQRFCYLVGP
jgi:maleate isomerase